MLKKMVAALALFLAVSAFTLSTPQQANAWWWYTPGAPLINSSSYGPYSTYYYTMPGAPVYSSYQSYYYTAPVATAYSYYPSSYYAAPSYYATPAYYAAPSYYATPTYYASPAYYSTPVYYSAGGRSYYYYGR